MESPSEPEKKPILIDPAVPEIERAMNLPELFGTERQKDWARVIRFRFLTNFYDNWLDVKEDCAIEEEDAAEREIAKIKRFRSCFQWIALKDEVRNAVNYVLNLVPDEVADKERAEAAERRKKLLRQIKSAVAANEWEKKNGLLPICGKKKLISIGARCRFTLREHEPDRARKEKRNAKYWIDLVNEKKSLADFSDEKLGLLF